MANPPDAVRASIPPDTVTASSAPPSRWPGLPLNRVAKTTAVVVATAVAVLALAGMLYSIRQVALTVFIGLFLAVGFEPAIRWLERRGIGRGRAVLTFVLCLLLALFAFVWLTLRPAIGQLQELVADIPQLIEQISDSQSRIGRWLSQPEVASRVERFVDSAPSYLVNSLGTVFGVVGAAVGAIFTFITVFTLMIYFMLEMPRMSAFFGRALQSPERRAVLEEALGKVGRYVTGQLTICLTAGVTSYLFFLLVGVPYAAVLAITIALLDAIPQVGATIGAVIACLVALTVSLPLALVTVAYFIVYQQLENYFIAPRLFAKAVNLSPVAVLVAILVGASIAGVVGALVALPTTAALKVVLRYVFRERLAEIDRQQPPTAPVHEETAQLPTAAAGAAGAGSSPPSEASSASSASSAGSAG